MLRLLFLLISFNSAWGACPLKDGDLIFIKSQSNQASLLKLVTGSDWTHVGMVFDRKGKWDVIEAIQPVQWNSLYSFIRRSHQLQFSIYRPLFSFHPEMVKNEAEKYEGKDYDLIFAWDNKRWYCSELVWKAYENTTGKRIGELQMIGDLKISHDSAINEMRKRYSSYGLNFDLEEWKKSQVITPVQMMRSELIEKVLTEKQISQLSECVKVR